MFFFREYPRCHFCSNNAEVAIRRKNYCTQHAEEYWVKKEQKPCKCGRPSDRYNTYGGRICEVCSERDYTRHLLRGYLQLLASCITRLTGDAVHREIDELQDSLKRKTEKNKTLMILISLPCGQRDLSNLTKAKESLDAMLILLGQIETSEQIELARQKATAN